MIQLLKQGPIQAGVTLKNNDYPSSFSMSLHTGHPDREVIQNREVLAMTLGYTLNDFVFANQTHSDNVYKVTARDKGRGARSLDDAVPHTDALYTTESNIVLVTMVADCVPIIFYNEKANIIGVIHSGWQGTVKEIVPKTFESIVNNENVAIEDFHLYVGLSISQEKFEVDRDVYELFAALGYANDAITYKEETNKWHIDTKRVIQHQIESLGIPKEQITIDTTCTFDAVTGFSYREERNCGRHAAFIVQR